jgi:hypothetical protein
MDQNKNLRKLVNESDLKNSFIVKYILNISNERFARLIDGTERATIEELVEIAELFCVDVEQIRD